MAIQTGNYTATERDYWMSQYETVAGEPMNPNTPHNEAVKLGMLADSGLSLSLSSTRETIEREFLKSGISATTTPTSERIPDLWLQLASINEINIVNKPWKQARHEYYLATL